MVENTKHCCLQKWKLSEHLNKEGEVHEGNVCPVKAELTVQNLVGR